MTPVKRKCKVLITEDDADDASFLQDSLIDNAFKGDIVHLMNGDELMNKLHTLKSDNLLPELIVLDLNMPFKSGYDVLNEIKDDPTLNTIPIAVVTASIRKEDETYCTNNGCTLFMRKPVSVKEYDKIGLELVTLLRGRYDYC